MEPSLHPAHQRLPRYRRVEGYANIRIGRPKQLIIEALGRFHYLSAPQLCRLLFSPTSLSYTHEHLKGLFHAGYVQRLYLPTPTPFGSPLAIYALDKKGFGYLKANTPDGALDGRFRATEQGDKQWLFLSHSLAVADFMILAEQIAKTRPDVTIAQMLHERNLKRNPIYVEDGKERIGVVPDCYLDIRQGKPAHRTASVTAFPASSTSQTCLAVEIDRSGGVERKPFRRKVRGFVHFSKGPYQQVFGTESLTVAVVVLGGERRLREVIAWTQDELKELKATDQADLYRFSAFDPAQADPYDVFFKKQWFRPFDSTPLSLLEDLTSGRTVN